MPKFPALHPTVRGWLLDGPLAEHVPAYLARLTEGRYASNTVARSLGALAHFAHWMALCRLSADRLDASRIEQFVGEHLPHCGCAGPAMRQPREAHAALMLLLALLRQRGVISDLPSPSGPIADELARYDARMRDARGLAAGTRRSQLRIVERLLLAKFAGRPFKFERLAPEDVRRFIAEQLELHNTTSNVLAINAALRGYLRWRGSCGDAVRPLLGVIVSPPHWSLASLPLALTSAQVDRVLNSFVGAGSLRTPKRGYAIVRLALDLGLRGAEINRMRLDDIDWHRLAARDHHAQAHEVQARGCAAVARSHRQGTGGLHLPRASGHRRAGGVRSAPGPSRSAPGDPRHPHGGAPRVPPRRHPA